ncbi:MAG: SMC-Scp complex subunit ScpB [Pirellulales bacterium]|nr:SMC-Scp complex subunit ScpB [Pirellulales bacterium]
MSDMPDQTPSEPEDQELSLRGLSEAFAEALSRGGETDASDEPRAEQPDADETTAGPPPEPDPRDDANDSCPITPRTILEAMLFVGDAENRPLESARAAELMRGVEPEDIPPLVDELNESYRQGGCPYHIVSDGGGLRLVLDEKSARVREKFYGRIHKARLSQAAVDILAIVAYRQPLGADEVSRLRNKPSHHILAQLVRRQLLRVQRPAQKPRKSLYSTTDRFLELFELENLADLPESEELNRS